jgi:hypothetical protein
MADMAKPEDAACLVVDETDCAIPAVGPAPAPEKAFLQFVTARFAK